MYIYDEHYETRMLNNQIAGMILTKGYGKERIRADCAEPKSNDELRSHGITRITPASKGADSIRKGIDTIQQYKIFVHPSCQNTVAELSSYIWAKNNDGSGKDKPVDKNNHLMDALRYAMEDMRYFEPISPETSRKWERQSDGGVLYRGNLAAEDFKGGWDGW
jgi:phage terminase large subunit